MTTMKKAVLFWVLLHGPGLASAICPTEDGLICLFPFKSGSTTYNKPADYKGRKWCATELKEDGQYKSYAYIDDLDNCKQGGPVPSDCPTEDGNKCIFPFKSGSTTYTECADYRGKKWCATALKSTGQYAKYGFCNTDKCNGGSEEKIRKLEKMMETMEEKIKELDTMLETSKKDSTELKSKLLKVPYMHTCGYANQTAESGTLIYDNSQSENFHDLSSLSITDGIFTARTKAFYMVSFSSSVALVDDSPAVLELLKNGESLAGGHTFSQTPTGAGGVTHQQVSRTLVVYMAEGDTLSLRAELTSGISETGFSPLSNISFCLTLSRPYKIPQFIPPTPQTLQCMRAGAPLRGRCINIEPGSHELNECHKYGYKIDCTDQSLCNGNGNGGPAACAVYKDICPQPPAVLCPPPINRPFRFAAVFPGPSGSFSYLPPARWEFPTGLSARPNSSIPCTCIAFVN